MQRSGRRLHATCQTYISTRVHIKPNASLSPLTITTIFHAKMDADATVTEHICERLNTAVDEELVRLQNSRPHVQVLSIKKIGQSASSSGDRYRVIVSDGEYFLQAMLATQINPLVENGQMCKNSIVRLDKFSVNGVKEDKRCAYIDASLSRVLTCTISGCSLFSN